MMQQEKEEWSCTSEDFLMGHVSEKELWHTVQTKRVCEKPSHNSRFRIGKRISLPRECDKILRPFGSARCIMQLSLHNANANLVGNDLDRPKLVG